MKDLSSTQVLPSKDHSSATLCCPNMFVTTSSGDCKHPSQDEEVLKKSNLSENLRSACTSFFAMLPEEVVRILLQWVDIPSLALITQTSKAIPASLALLASDDTTWLSLVSKRFNIAAAPGSVAQPRSKSYGGATWKAAYRSMALANRLPKCKAMPRKHVVFAKGGNERQSVSMWIMLSHTDDCNTRIVPSTTTRNANSSSSSSNSDESSINNDVDHEENDEAPRQRYIELRVCLQNIKSGCGSVNINLEEASANVIGPRGISMAAACSPRIIFESSDDTKPSVSSKQSKRKKYGLDGRGRHSRSAAGRIIGDDSGDKGRVSHITLEPFEFTVASLRVPCTPDMRYETDFLSRAHSVKVPVSWPLSSTASDHVKCQVDTCYAKFMSEPHIWEHYIELPGGCLTLADRNHVMSV
mmetsp:Transcript_27654/g.55857  ORF Transcript_27654/g.55857 Transcript_27654/m.55857 type:complete len:413 (-) Transcript_27654:465-1703(-)